MHDPVAVPDVLIYLVLGLGAVVAVLLQRLLGRRLQAPPQSSS
jgi:hypothetical protein